VSDRVVLLDGATGTELSRRGADTRLPLWSARPLGQRPELVVEVHRDYLRAGCDVLTACTFRTHERSLARGGWAGRGDELNRAAVSCAREAVAAEGSTRARVAGSLAPLEDCFRPDLVPDGAALEAEHRRQAESLAAAGCDLLLVETMATLREARAALRAALGTGLPAWCSFVTDGRGRLLSGEALDEAARTAERAGAAVVLVNCVPVVHLAAEVRVLAASCAGAFGGYGNVGHAEDVDGWRVELMLEPDEFAARTHACRALGATVLGGCCGTEPRHLEALARAIGRAEE
jgi:S-methylmethionine-dependent homocysteine/selenocysteine methylase